MLMPFHMLFFSYVEQHHVWSSPVNLAVTTQLLCFQRHSGHKSAAWTWMLFTETIEKWPDIVSFYTGLSISAWKIKTEKVANTDHMYIYSLIRMTLNKKVDHISGGWAEHHYLTSGSGGTAVILCSCHVHPTGVTNSSSKTWLLKASKCRWIFGAGRAASILFPPMSLVYFSKSHQENLLFSASNKIKNIVRINLTNVSLQNIHSATIQSK